MSQTRIRKRISIAEDVPAEGSRRAVLRLPANTHTVEVFCGSCCVYFYSLTVSYHRICFFVVGGIEPQAMCIAVKQMFVFLFFAAVLYVCYLLGDRPPPPLYHRQYRLLWSYAGGIRLCCVTDRFNA